MRVIFKARELNRSLNVTRLFFIVLISSLLKLNRFYTGAPRTHSRLLFRQDLKCQFTRGVDNKTRSEATLNSKRNMFNRHIGRVYFK